MDDASASVSQQRTARLGAFARCVASSPHNLVSAKSRDELTTRHIPESVAFADLLPGPGRCLDIGSGGGFPGLVIAICRSDLEVHLMEATAKKARFLRETADLLGLHVRVHTGRAEDLARGELMATFDVITARAVAPLDRLVELAAPFLRRSGRLYAIKGDRWPQELEAASAVIQHSGLTILGTPDSDERLRPDPQCPQMPRVVMLGRLT